MNNKLNPQCLSSDSSARLIPLVAVNPGLWTWKIILPAQTVLGEGVKSTPAELAVPDYFSPSTQNAPRGMSLASSPIVITNVGRRPW